MTVSIRITLSVGIAIGACMMTTPTQTSAQSTVKKVETTAHKATKTTKHNLKALGRSTKKAAHKTAKATSKAAHSTSRATSNLIHGHRILCDDGTWASRDPTCSDHGGVASRQPGEKDKDK